MLCKQNGNTFVNSDIILNTEIFISYTEWRYFSKPTRIGANLVTCGIWIFNGTCPVLKKPLLLIIYWTSSFSLNFSTLRDLHKGNRTWAGEAKSQSMCYFCFEWIWLKMNKCTYCQSSFLICDICWLSVLQRWCPTKPDHCPALPPRSWGSDASTERGAHPWTVSVERSFIFANAKIRRKSHPKW